MEESKEKAKPTLGTLKITDPVFTYSCTCGRCWGHMVPLSKEQAEVRIKKFKQAGFIILE